MIDILAAALILTHLLHLVHGQELLLLVSSNIVTLYGATSRLNLINVEIEISRLLQKLLFRFAQGIGRAV